MEITKDLETTLRMLLSLLLVNFGTISAHAAPRDLVGMNADRLYGANSYCPFTNYFHLSGRFQMVKAGAPWIQVAGDFPHNADDYPTQMLPNIWYMTYVLLNGTGGNPPGPWVCLYNGKGSINLTGDIKNLKFNDGRITFDMNPVGAPTLQLFITNTDPAEPIVNIRVGPAMWEANLDDGNPNAYNPDFIRELSNFGAFRAVDYLRSFDYNGPLSDRNPPAFQHTVANADLTSITFTDTDPNGNPVNSTPDFYKGMVVTYWDPACGLPNNICPTQNRYITGYDADAHIITMEPAADYAVKAGKKVTIGFQGPLTWAERPMPTEIVQSYGNLKCGMAIEHIVNICNLANVSLWYPVPISASDEYLVKLADYIRDNLKPGLKLYLANGCEVWNNQSQGYFITDAMGHYMKLPGWQAHSYYAYRCVHVSNIFHQEFGEPILRKDRAPGTSRIESIIEGQAGGFTTDMLDFGKNPKYTGEFFDDNTPASAFVDAYAIAPYYGWDKAAEANLSDTEGLLNSIETEIKTTRHNQHIKSNLKIATDRDLNLVTYENGLSWGYPSDGGVQWADREPLIRALMYHPRLRYLVAFALRDWFSFPLATPTTPGIGITMQYNFFCAGKDFTKFGPWGNRTPLYGPDPMLYPKWAGLMDFLNGRSTPIPPYRLQASPLNSNTVTLTWSRGSSDQTGFRIERYLGNSGPYTVLVDGLPADAVSYSDNSGLSPGTQCTYRAVAYNDAGPSEYSNEATATTPPAGVDIPLPPQNLMVGSDSSSTMFLRWVNGVPDTNRTATIVEAKYPGAADFVVIATLDPTMNSYIDDGLSGAGVFTYRVAAANGSYQSSYSNEDSAKLYPGWAEGSGAPSKLVAVVTDVVKLTWKNNSANITTNTVERKAFTDADFAPVSDVGPAAVTYTDAVPSVGAYYYRIKMTDNAGKFRFSNIVLADVLTASAPLITLQPQDLTVPEGQTATFSVNAGGQAPLAYQWQMNNISLMGATSPTYTTPPVSFSDNGEQFSCTVSNSVGSILSRSALLAVTAASSPTNTSANSTDPQVIPNVVPLTDGVSQQTVTVQNIPSGTTAILFYTSQGTIAKSIPVDGGVTSWKILIDDKWASGVYSLVFQGASQKKKTSNKCKLVVVK